MNQTTHIYRTGLMKNANFTFGFIYEPEKYQTIDNKVHLIYKLEMMAELYNIPELKGNKDFESILKILKNNDLKPR
ncbi:hypothetical protein [Heyndrickxia acidicola]|uniref:Uncharacterized protein n=1 Tax=Heyndrickxia acidicola TaxID=209389 RepID=A0ABU6MM59_9BACI|nr:hypothetical protein [Heyndrickxia acidicola]MED1205584.1 hypothetical protein [Heyndrickxia acidicola]